MFVANFTEIDQFSSFLFIDACRGSDISYKNIFWSKVEPKVDIFH